MPVEHVGNGEGPNVPERPREVVEIADTLPYRIPPMRSEPVLRSRTDLPPLNITLSDRERKALVLIAHGGRGQALNEEMGISGKTVEGHIRNVRLRNGCNSRLQAILASTETGVLSREEVANEQIIIALHTESLKPTQEEADVLNAMTNGLGERASDKEIAGDLNVTVAQVRAKFKSLRKRIPFGSREEIGVNWYLVHGDVLEPADALHERAGDRVDRITYSQEDALKLRGLGLTPDEIAEEMRIAPDTARRHLSDAYDKLQATSPLNGVLIGMAADIFDADDVRNYEVIDRLRNPGDNPLTSTEVKVLNAITADLGSRSRYDLVAEDVKEVPSASMVSDHMASIAEKLGVEGKQRQMIIGVNWYLYRQEREQASLPLSERYLEQHPHQAAQAVPSDREREILILKAKGLDVVQVARRLKVTAPSVASHLLHMRQRFGFGTTREAILHCLNRTVIYEGQVADEDLISAFTSPHTGSLTPGEIEQLDDMITLDNESTKEKARKMGISKPEYTRRISRIKQKLIGPDRQQPTQEQLITNWFIYRRRAEAAEGGV